MEMEERIEAKSVAKPAKFDFLFTPPGDSHHIPASVC
jgi:hypothetical protein